MTPPTRPEDRSLTVLNEDHRPWEVKAAIVLFRFHARLERRLSDVFGAHGLTLAQFDVLATLGHGEGITQQELAERLLVSKGNVVGLIDRVGAAGWVERRPDPEDRRANRLYLTEAGKTLLAQAFPSQADFMKKLFGILSAGELRLFHELLEKLEGASQKCL